MCCIVRRPALGPSLFLLMSADAASKNRKFAPSALARVGGVDVDDTPSPRRLHADPLLETAWTLLSRVACLKQGR